MSDDEPKKQQPSYDLDMELRHQLEAIRAEEIPDRLLKLARELQVKLRRQEAEG